MKANTLTVQTDRGALTGFPAASDASLERLLASFFAGRSPHTLTAYRADVEQFAGYLRRSCELDADTPQLEALRVFFCSNAGRANEIVLNYRAEMRQQDKAPKTINRRLAAIRSLVKLGRLTGAIAWSIEVSGVPDELTRDTRGPSSDVVATLIHAAGEQRNGEIAARDAALLRLMFDLGLRISEVTGLNIADVELSPAGVWILGKHRARKQLLTMPAPTVAAMQRWLTARGRASGPLFLSFSGAKRQDGRLTVRGAYRVIRDLGAKIGIRLHPHALRHSAITEAVQQSVALGLSLDQVRDFSRHKSIATLMVYRDSLTNEQGTLASAVAATAPTKADRDVNPQVSGRTEQS